jgi:biopolymer transport protein ExbD
MSLLSARGEEEVMAEINITPFTDVLLVLLIIFMILAALAAPPGFEKQLAKSSNQPTSQKNIMKNNIVVTVNDKGQIRVDGTEANASTIYYVLGTDIARRGKKHIALIADAKAPYGIIIRILDAARRAGTDDVGFVTS